MAYLIYFRANFEFKVYTIRFLYYLIKEVEDLNPVDINVAKFGDALHTI